MDAVVICGGKGTRVRSITNDEIPKIMIPVNGKPFLEHLVTHLYHLGARNIVFAAGFKGEVIESYLKKRGIYSHVYPWPRLSVLLEDKPLDTGGAVLHALEASGYGLHSDPFLVLNGDCLLPLKDCDCFEELYYDACYYGTPEVAMFTCNMQHDGRYGSLVIDDDGWVVDFKSGKAGKSWINCGYYVMRRSFFKGFYNPIANRDVQQVYDVKKVSLEKDLFPGYLEDGQVITPLKIDEDEFLEIGTPEALAQAQEKLK